MVYVSGCEWVSICVGSAPFCFPEGRSISMGKQKGKNLLHIFLDSAGLGNLNFCADPSSEFITFEHDPDQAMYDMYEIPKFLDGFQLHCF